MAQKIMKRAGFAKLAGVTRAAITLACRNGLSGAVVGDRIDASHPAALEYVRARQASLTGASTTNGLDPLYYVVAAWCRETGRYVPRAIRDHFGIGSKRVKEIFEFMRASGDLPSSSDAFAGSLPTDPPPGTTHPLAVTAPVAPSSPSLTGEGLNSLTGGSSPNAPVYATVDDGVAAGAVLSQFDPGVIPEEIKAFRYMMLDDLIQKFGTDLRFKDWLAATKEIERIDEVRIKNAKQLGQLVSRKAIKEGVFDPVDAMLRQLLTDGASTIVARLVPMHEAGRDTKELEEFVREQIGSYIRPMKTKIARGLRDAS